MLLLTGPMGSGKTTFTRALAEGLGVLRPKRVCSPTYTVCMDHDGPIPLVHIDLYRLAEHGDGALASAGFEALGLDYDELPGPNRVLIVEWADLWRDPPDDHLRLEFAAAPAEGPQFRRLMAVGTGSRGALLAERWERGEA